MKVEDMFLTKEEVSRLHNWELDDLLENSVFVMGDDSTIIQRTLADRLGMPYTPTLSVSELLEILPDTVEDDKNCYYLVITKTSVDYDVSYQTMESRILDTYLYDGSERDLVLFKSALLEALIFLSSIDYL